MKKQTTENDAAAIAGSNMLATDLVSKDEAIKLSMQTLVNIIEANKWRIEKIQFVKEQNFSDAADARGQEKKYLDQIPTLEEIEKLIQIAMS